MPPLAGVASPYSLMATFCGKVPAHHARVHESGSVALHTRMPSPAKDLLALPPAGPCGPCVAQLSGVARPHKQLATGRISDWPLAFVFVCFFGGTGRRTRRRRAGLVRPQSWTCVSSASALTPVWAAGPHRLIERRLLVVLLQPHSAGSYLGDFGVAGHGRRRLNCVRAGHVLVCPLRSRHDRARRWRGQLQPRAACRSSRGPTGWPCAKRPSPRRTRSCSIGSGSSACACAVRPADGARGQGGGRVLTFAPF